MKKFKEDRYYIYDPKSPTHLTKFTEEPKGNNLFALARCDSICDQICVQIFDRKISSILPILTTYLRLDVALLDRYRVSNIDSYLEEYLDSVLVLFFGVNTKDI